MFFLKQLTRELLLHPMHFGPKLHDIIRLRLIEEVEGASLGKHGYVVTVTEVRDEDIVGTPSDPQDGGHCTLQGK